MEEIDADSCGGLRGVKSSCCCRGRGVGASWPFSLNSSADKSIEVTPFPHFEQLSNLPKILKEQFISLSLLSHILETSLFWLLSLSLSPEAANAEVISVLLDHIGAPNPL